MRHKHKGRRGWHPFRRRPILENGVYGDDAVVPVEFPTPTFQAHLDAGAAEVVDLAPSAQYEAPAMYMGPPPCINYPRCLQPAGPEHVCRDESIEPTPIPSELRRLNEDD